MIEDGLVDLIQSGLGNPPMAPGGFAVVLPKDLIGEATPMAWTYRSITSEAVYTLTSQDPFTTWEVEIACHGYTPNDAFSLARAIDSVLRGGFHGTLPDQDKTSVYGIFRRAPAIDGYSDANHTYVRTLEYRVDYNQI